ncbi:MAG: hypothetical protein J2P15_04825 [Micromonosporaceae bacterium]|nr:hypothetical protein [Micromonosporaceae bacterium]
MSVLQPPPKNKHTLRTVLIIVGVVLVVCCAGGIAGGYAIYRGVNAATGPARDTVNTFLGDLEGGNTAGAYAYLCGSTRQKYTTDAFTAVLGQRPKLVSHSITGTSVNNVNGTVSASVSARLSFVDGSSDLHVFILNKEGGGWRICGDPY